MSKGGDTCKEVNNACETVKSTCRGVNNTCIASNNTCTGVNDTYVEGYTKIWMDGVIASRRGRG